MQCADQRVEIHRAFFRKMNGPAGYRRPPPGIDREAADLKAPAGGGAETLCRQFGGRRRRKRGLARGLPRKEAEGVSAARARCVSVLVRGATAPREAPFASLSCCSARGLPRSAGVGTPP